MAGRRSRLQFPLVPAMEPGRGDAGKRVVPARCGARYPARMPRASQPDLFAPQGDLFAAGAASAPRTPEELALIRRDLYPPLAEAEAAERLPWSHTRATVVEIPMAAWAAALPETEAAEVRARFAAAMDRHWAAEPDSGPG